jgi:hypothetical protein
VLHPTGVDPLGGLHVERAIAAGESQSADFMVTYVNALALQEKLFDGYLIHSRLHGTVGLAPAVGGNYRADIAARPPMQIRDDLDVPVMMLQTETDLFQLGSYADRQPDTAKFRLWEIAGTSHADLYETRNGLTDVGNDPSVAAVVEVASPYPGLLDCAAPINSGPHHFLVNAAISALDGWIRNGAAPAYADRLDVAGDPPALAKDSIGNVSGGIRTPYVDVPVAVLSGVGQTGALCSLFGTTALLDSTQLSALYPDHATFVSQVNTSVDSAVLKGFLLQPDADLIKAWAQSSSFGGP